VSRIIYFILVSCAASLSLAQDQVIDPTRPLHFSAADVSTKGEQETIQLTSILISSDRKVAIINGQVLGENQTVKGIGAQIKKIDAEAVTFQQNGKVWRVLLNNTAVRK
jgi:MSHA biogenesis protein MshK